MKLFGGGLLAGFLVIVLFGFAFKKELKAFLIGDNRVQLQWYPPETPTKASFAGETVPLNQEQNRERFEKQLISNEYYHSHTLYILKLKTRIFPIIEKILKENGLPDDFKYLCVAESSLETPTSPAGARGYWQFVDGTAKQYGLTVTSEVDDRYDLTKSTLAACQYFKDAYNQFGNWTAAAASFNCGRAGYAKRVTEQGTTNYYDLLLPEETNDYLFRILALKEIVGDPEKYGFHIPEEDEYHELNYRELKVTQSVPDLAAFALQNGTNYKAIRFYNPWIRGKSLTLKDNDSLILHLPK